MVPPRICRRTPRRRCASAERRCAEPARLCGAGVRSFAAADQQHVEITPLYALASGDDAPAVEACAKILRPVLTVAAEHYCSAARVGTRREARPRLDRAAPRRRRKSAAHRRTATDRDRAGSCREARASSAKPAQMARPTTSARRRTSGGARRYPTKKDGSNFTVVLPRRKVVRRSTRGALGRLSRAITIPRSSFRLYVAIFSVKGAARSRPRGAFESRAEGHVTQLSTIWPSPSGPFEGALAMADSRVCVSGRCEISWPV